MCEKENEIVLGLKINLIKANVLNNVIIDELVFTEEGLFGKDTTSNTSIFLMGYDNIKPLLKIENGSRKWRKAEKIFNQSIDNTVCRTNMEILFMHIDDNIKKGMKYFGYCTRIGNTDEKDEIIIFKQSEVINKKSEIVREYDSTLSCIYNSEKRIVSYGAAIDINDLMKLLINSSSIEE